MTCNHPKQRVLTFWTRTGALRRALFVCLNPRCRKRRFHNGRYWMPPKANP